jgi:hypothetical protein
MMTKARVMVSPVPRQVEQPLFTRPFGGVDLAQLDFQPVYDKLVAHAKLCVKPRL